MSSATDEMVFDTIDPIVVPVTIGKEKYELRDAGGEAATWYRDQMLNHTQLDEDNHVVGVSSLASIELGLLCRCIFKPGAEEPLGDAVRKWPYRILKPLCERVKEISELWVGRKNPSQPGVSRGTPGG